MCLMLLSVAAQVLVGNLRLTNWFFIDASPTHWNAARVIQLVLSGSNPVIVGCVVDTDPTSPDRLFSCREYTTNGSADTVWTHQYNGGDLDDDGYCIVRYETTGNPPAERFVCAGFHQVNLEDSQTDPKALVIGLDDSGDTCFSYYTFDSTNWTDVCCRDMDYVGSLKSYGEAYAVCGWYYDDVPAMRGFVHIACEDDSICLLKSSATVCSWEEVAYDSNSDALALGGFKDDISDNRDNLRFGIVDLDEASYSIDTEEYDYSDWVFVEGPLLVISPGLYLYLGVGGNGTDEEGIAATLWTWHEGAPDPLTFEAARVYANDTSDTDLYGYESIGAIGAAYHRPGRSEEVIVIVEADDDHDSDYILVTSFPVNTAARDFGAMTVDTAFEVTGMPSGFTIAEGCDFHFTSTNPVEGFGGGLVDNTTSQGQDCRFWIFEIEDRQLE